MLGVLLGTLVGIFIRQIVWGLCVFFLRSRLRAPHKGFESEEKEFTITSVQAELCKSSLHRCNDLDWLNVFLQRYFIVAGRSYAFKERIKAILIKKASPFLQYKLIRKMEITRLDLGNEFVVVKNVTVLADSDFDNLVSTLHDIREESESTHRGTGGESRHKQSGINLLEVGADPEVFRSGNEEEHRKIYRSIFKNCLLLAEISFNGEINLHTCVVVPGGIKYNLNIFLRRFGGKVLMRMPSKLHQTRLEMSFISNPRFEIEIASLGDKNPESFKSFSIRYFRKMFMYSLTNAVVYPSWNSFYLPLVCPSLRDVTHRFEKLGGHNYVDVSRAITNRILLYTSMDYKIIRKTLTYLKRRIQYHINGTGRIFRYELPVPSAVEIEGQEENTKVFASAGRREASVLSSFYELRALMGAFGGFVGLRSVRSFDNAVSLVMLYFSDNSYPFVRICGDHFIIFHSNDEKFPEFMVFQAVRGTFYIYQYGTRKNLTFSDSRVARVIGRLGVPGAKIREKRGGIGKIFSFGLRRKSRNRSRTSLAMGLEPPKMDVELPSEEIYGVFAHYESIMSRSTNSLIVNEMKTELNKHDMLEILLDDTCRFQLIGQSFDIIGQSRLNDSVYTSILSDPHGKEDDVIIHTFVNEFYIIDMNAEGNALLQGFTLEEIGDAGTKIRIFSQQELSQIKFAKFMTHLNLLMHHNKIRGIVEQREDEKIKLGDTYERAVQCSLGAVFIEFFTGKTFSVMFSASKNARQNFFLKNIAIPSNSKAQFIFPTQSKDRIILFFATKQNVGEIMSLKIVQLPLEFCGDSFFNVEVVLKSEKSVTVPVFGDENDFLFWKVPPSIYVQMELGRENETIELKNPSIVRAKSGQQHFLYKNLRSAAISFKIHVGTSKFS